ncbi:MAG: HAD family hydrolase [Hyphomicrobiales bacterium]|nr:HAD family hydrolase [Hyphomicrobiales bacterium]MCY4048554.1 HAD family hydrolase [Hyphomicrobiales bacterium]
MIEGVLFDKDGTLFDYHATWHGVFRDLAHDLCEGDEAGARLLLEAGGYDVEGGFYRSNSILSAGDTRELAQVWARQLGRDAGALLPHMERVFSTEPVASAVPAADLKSLLETLRSRSLSLGIATHDSLQATENVLARFSLREYFDFLTGYDCGHGSKPGGGMALAFCKAVGVAPGRIVVIGDNPHDLGMGRNAGAAAVLGVLTGSSRRGDLVEAGADDVLESVADLPAWLDGNSGIVPEAACG